MSSITLHLIDKDGYYDSTLTSDVNNVLNTIALEGLDFTMQQPPEDYTIRRYRWLNNEWVENIEEEINHD